MKKLSICALTFLMSLGHAKENETTPKKQPGKMAENLSKEARELPYFRLPWMDENYDRWSQTRIRRRALSAKQLKALPPRVDNSTNKAWQGIGDQGRTNSCSQEGTVAEMLSYELSTI